MRVGEGWPAGLGARVYLLWCRLPLRDASQEPCILGSKAAAPTSGHDKDLIKVSESHPSWRGARPFAPGSLERGGRAPHPFPGHSQRPRRRYQHGPGTLGGGIPGAVRLFSATKPGRAPDAFGEPEESASDGCGTPKPTALGSPWASARGCGVGRGLVRFRAAMPAGAVAGWPWPGSRWWDRSVACPRLRAP